MSDNPLMKYSARPGTYVTLPSKGKYYQNEIELTADGELEIRPMTASDEIRLKNPDGLMNSNSLYQVIEHIAPAIKNAKNMPTPDLDVIVIGMRIATYGEMMDVISKCQECNHEDTYQINLTQILAGAKSITAPDVIKIGDLEVTLRPQTSESKTMMNNYKVEVSRAARQLEHSTASGEDEINSEFVKILQKGSSLIFEIAAKHIVSVSTPDDETITDHATIYEWLDDMAAPDYQVIRDAVNLLSEEVINRNFKFACTECENVNDVEVSFDPANFFGTSSL